MRSSLNKQLTIWDLSFIWWWKCLCWSSGFWHYVVVLSDTSFFAKCWYLPRSPHTVTTQNTNSDTLTSPQCRMSWVWVQCRFIWRPFFPHLLQSKNFVHVRNVNLLLWFRPSWENWNTTAGYCHKICGFLPTVTTTNVPCNIFKYIEIVFIIRWCS